MKNRFVKILLIILLSKSYFILTYAEEFIFTVPEVQIESNGNIYKGIKRGKIITDKQTEIVSNNFIYLKDINSLEANGKVILTDKKNNIIINAEKIFYLKNDEKIYTVGQTTITVSNEYIFKGDDLTFNKNQMILSSKKPAIINDSLSNVYKLNKFEYSIDKEILKGDEIEVVTEEQNPKSDKYFFKTGFYNLKEKKFLAKDVNIEFHKSLFDNTENDPRLSAVSGYGDENNTYFKKAIWLLEAWLW